MIWHSNDDAVVEKLKAMWIEGKSAGEIAACFEGATRNAVIGKVHRLGLTRSPYAVLSSLARPSSGRVKKPKAVKPPKPPRVERPAPAVREIVAAPVVDISNARPWLARTVRECAWLLEDGAACCGETKAGSSYCAGHHSIAYRPTSSASSFEKSLRRYA